MNILGIETSCDETAAAVVRNGTFVLSNIVASSLKEHAQHGGIIPEIASRRQLEFIHAITERSLAKAGLKLKNIDAVAVTNQPGLIGSLLVGISFARGLSFAINKPLIDVNHIEAHAYANFLEFSGTQTGEKKPRGKPELPAIALVVSGGHTNLYHIKAFDRFRLLGQTLDDAAGEAFDKVAAILGLGYPGGPVVDRTATGGDPKAFDFPRSMLGPGSLDFSFSGLKTAVLYRVRGRGKRGITPLDVSDPQVVADVCASFQAAVVDVLTRKTLKAADQAGMDTILVCGGVAANSHLREAFERIGADGRHRVIFPEMKLCTDNAAMMAVAWEKWQRGESSGLDLPAVA
ncbi:MAG: tRNA (adenosine(37)-N6)-threonylcarbamoyltransferase complex transferase subunit TsaD [Hyphomicrobiaceae bacterium]|nr:tRNA (adenosine(37)-N6)-threonylcarbamoyltransferase complex transferase subunit TsaD [Hyphomicrobiaceae bacterium]